MTNSLPTLEMTPDEFRALGKITVDLIADQLAALQNRAWPAHREMPPESRASLQNEPAPESGSTPETILARYQAEIMPYALGNITGRFFAWVNSTPAPIGILAELLAAAHDSSVTTSGQSAYYVEHAVLNWMKQIMHMPAEAGAILVSGGSMANLVCLAAMRQRMMSAPARRDGFYNEAAPMIVYTSVQGHSCIQKAIETLGFGHAHLRHIAIDSDYRMDLNALRIAIETDRAAGLRPVCIAASAGTVNTGAIDPLDSIANVCTEYGLWFHVDGAYGGLGILAPSAADLYHGIERADSIAIDQHKWMYAPIECGCALVRDANLLRDTFSLMPPYLRDGSAEPWLSEYTPQQTRGFRALKLWMQIQQIGLSGYRSLIQRDIDLARSLQGKIEAHPDFRLIATGPLSIVCFQYAPEGTPTEELPALNQRLLEAVQREGEVFTTGTTLNDQFVIRACVVSFRMTEADLDVLLAAFVRAAQLDFALADQHAQ